MTNKTKKILTVLAFCFLFTGCNRVDDCPAGERKTETWNPFLGICSEICVPVNSPFFQRIKMKPEDVENHYWCGDSDGQLRDDSPRKKLSKEDIEEIKRKIWGPDDQ